MLADGHATHRCSSSRAEPLLGGVALNPRRKNPHPEPEQLAIPKEIFLIFVLGCGNRTLCDPICHSQPLPPWNHRGTTAKEPCGTSGNLNPIRYARDQGTFHAPGHQRNDREISET